VSSGRSRSSLWADDIKSAANAFGPQKESFEADLDVRGWTGLTGPFSFLR